MNGKSLRQSQFQRNDLTVNMLLFFKTLNDYSNFKFNKCESNLKYAKTNSNIEKIYILLQTDLFYLLVFD